MADSRTQGPDLGSLPLGRRIWWYAFFVWTLLGLLSWTQFTAQRSYRGMVPDWYPGFPNSLLDWWTCGLFTPAFYWVARRFPIRGRRWWAALPVHLLASLLFVLAKSAIFLPIWRALHPGIPYTFVMMLAGNTFADLLGYWGSVGVIYAVEYHREAQERSVMAAKLDGELRAAELENLKSQLHPHFLFNTLQGISTLIHRDPPAADRMLNDLSELLRVSLRHTAAQEVALRDELAFLGRYLDIMRQRFGDRLTIDLDVAPDVLDARVPSLVLQPLAENAIRHGMADRQDRGRVTVRGRRDGASLLLEVADDGLGLSREGTGEGNGIGLSNTRERLARLYGAEGQLTVSSNPGLAPGVGTTVRMLIPYRKVP